jgi:hypothetical protein
MGRWPVMPSNLSGFRPNHTRTNLAACPHDLGLSVDRLSLLKLVNQMCVGGEQYRYRMSKLPGDVEGLATFREQQRREGMTQVIWTGHGVYGPLPALALTGR